MRFYYEQLANGLTLIGEDRPAALSSALGVFVRTGARDETPEVSGVSHFLEHMMFKGTAKRNALELTYQLGALGAQANAFTSEENTVYYASVLPEYLDDSLEILCDMLRPSLDPHEFDTEKKVILEEIALYQDRPTHVLFEATMREYFGAHGAGNSVLGSTQSISALTRDQMKSYFDRRYSTPNMVLAVSGQFDWPHFVDLAQKYCASWSTHAAERVINQHQPARATKSLTKENLQRAHTMLVGPGPAADDERRYEISVLACILGDSSGSRAYWELVDKGIADAAYIDSDDMDATGMIYAYASTLPDDLERVTATLQKIMAGAKEFSDAELERAKTKLATRAVLDGEGTRRRLMSIGLDWIYRSDYTTLDDEIVRIKKITKKDILAALEEFPFQPFTTVTMSPA